VTDDAVQTSQRLHAKIERKDTVDEHNTKECASLQQSSKERIEHIEQRFAQFCSFNDSSYQELYHRAATFVDRTNNDTARSLQMVNSLSTFLSGEEIALGNQTREHADEARNLNATLVKEHVGGQQRCAKHAWRVVILEVEGAVECAIEGASNTHLCCLI
jgi:hypothetical protein